MSSPALAAIEACSSAAPVAEATAWARDIAAVRADLVDRLAALPVRVVPAASASFVLVETDRPDVRERLLGKGFAVRRGETFPGLGPQWIRLAVRDRPTSAALCAALAEVLG